MTYTGIHPFLFSPGSFFPNNCMIQPFQLISVSHLIAQSIAGVHAFPNSTGHHLVPLVPDLSFRFDISSLSPRDVSERSRSPVPVCLWNDACQRGMT